MPTTADVLRVAREYLGVPWRHRGRTRTGIDCGGLLIQVAAELGVPVTDVRTYSRQTSYQEMLHIFDERFELVEPTNRTPGYIVLFRDHSLACHSGLIGSKKFGAFEPETLTVIHAMSAYSGRTGLTMEEPMTAEFTDRLVAVYRFKGVEG